MFGVAACPRCSGKVSLPNSAPTAATLEGDAADLCERVTRLLVPAEAAAPSGATHRWILLFLALAVLAGVFGGEAIIGGALQ